MIMKKKLLGLVSIGQSPRQDYIQAFKPYAPDAEIRVVGALDGKSRDEIDRLAQQPAAYPLLTRLTDGDHVEIGLRQIHRAKFAGTTFGTVISNISENTYFHGQQCD